jgi:hypothetical protein
MQKILDTQNTNYLFVCSLIPEFMNSLYKEESLNSTDLKEIRDAFRVKQILGKSELISRIDSLVTKESKILIIGSWIGFTSYCLYKLGFSSITEIDPDSRLTTISTHFNRFNKSFKHITDDVNNIDLAEYDCVVNTSCEHILSNKWFNDIREDATIFLQSTDYPSWDHVNTCKTIEEMINKYPLDTILHSETIDLQTYKRFMLIGKKI